MATFEERLTSIEHGHDELKQKIELQSIAIGALVNKATLEKLNEKNDAIFSALMAHDQFTNQQLAELREKVEVDVEGKIVGMRTEMRRGFDAIGVRLEQIDTRFEQIDTRFDAMDARFEQIDTRFDAMDARFEQIIFLLNAQAPRRDQ